MRIAAPAVNHRSVAASYLFNNFSEHFKDRQAQGHPKYPSGYKRTCKWQENYMQFVWTVVQAKTGDENCQFPASGARHLRRNSSMMSLIWNITETENRSRWYVVKLRSEFLYFVWYTTVIMAARSGFNIIVIIIIATNLCMIQSRCIFTARSEMRKVLL